MSWLKSDQLTRRTLCKSQCPKDAKFHICVVLRAVDDGVVCPDAEPVVVAQRGSLLEGIEEEDGEGKAQTHSLEVLHVHLQLHLCTVHMEDRVELCD